MRLIFILCSNFCYQAVNDNIPEQKSLYSVQLTSATEGATISTAAGASEATVVMVASDHPHGLFEFSTPMEITEIEFAKPVSDLNIHY